MNIAFKSFLAAVLILLTPSCSSSRYKITLRDGRTYMAANRPEYSPKTGYYRFKNLGDKEALMRADEVLLITEM